MDKFRDWVRQTDHFGSTSFKGISVMLVLDEISTNVIALSGNGLFTVNYTFVAQVRNQSLKVKIYEFMKITILITCYNFSLLQQ